MRIARLAALALLLLWTAPVRALCSGSSVDREFRDADIVVRARVVAEARVWDDEPSPAYRARWGDYSPVMLHRLRVLQVFKGRPGPTINLFQEVTSGRFDLDPAGDYLLFLTYHRPFPGRGSAARGAMYVPNTCGQSKLWSTVAPAALDRLRFLSRRR